MMFDADSESTVGTPTCAPRVGPTMPPAFNLQEFARDSSLGGRLVLSPDTVLEVVPNVSWSAANLDLVELNVVRHIDGITPLCLLETIVGISRDELQVMVAMLLARLVVAVVPPAPEELSVEGSEEDVWLDGGSGVFPRVSFGWDEERDTDLACTG